MLLSIRGTPASQGYYSSFGHRISEHWSALFGFGPKAHQNTGTILKISTVTDEVKWRKLNRAAWMNEERSVGFVNYEIHTQAGFELAVCNLQFVKHFGGLWMSFCIFSKNCKSLKSDTSWIFRVIHWTSYIGSYFKSNKYALLNNNVISQRFIVHINFKSHTSSFSIVLLRSNKMQAQDEFQKLVKIS